MTRLPTLLIAFLWLLSGASLDAEAKVDLQIGLAYESVAVTADFVGDDVVLFGSIENGDPDDLRNGRYDVVIVIVGPEEDVVIRRKERIFGIWINGSNITYSRVPSFFSVAANRPLGEVASDALLVKNRISFDRLPLTVAANPLAADEVVFRQSLTRIKMDRNLAKVRPNGVRFLSKTLFRARLHVPSNVPIGRHTVRAFLFKKGELLVRKAARLSVRKTGFEQWTYNLAHRNGILYGILAVLIAVATGWLASVVFRKD